MKKLSTSTVILITISLVILVISANIFQIEILDTVFTATLVLFLFYVLILQNRKKEDRISRRIRVSENNLSHIVDKTFTKREKLFTLVADERNKVADERNKVADERNKLKRENDELRHSNASISSEMDALHGEVEGIIAERNSSLLEVQRLYLRMTHNERELARIQIRSELEKELEPVALITANSSVRKKAQGRVNGSGVLTMIPESYYGSNYHKDIFFGEKFILKSNSLYAREIVARSTSSNEYGFDDLILMIRIRFAKMGGPKIEEKIRSWKHKPLLSMARIITSQNFVESDAIDAIAIFDCVESVFGFNSLTKADIFTYIEALTELNKISEVERILNLISNDDSTRVQPALIKSNMVTNQKNDFLDSGAEWIAMLNYMYKSYGLAEISLDSTDGHALDRLTSKEVLEKKRGPLVSVIMPTYNGSAHIKTAVKSILAQTWHDIELLIVDDGSENVHWEYLQRELPSDDRLRILRVEENGGAYHARNVGLEHSTGTYITVHDDDDWSHPQKIETQISELLSQESSVGNMSYMTRIDENGLFIRINDNPEFNQRNYSSMLISRELMEQIGHWDEVSRGGDAEFHERVSAVTGKRIEGVLTPPLSFARSRSGSLTAGEIRKGYIDPLRVSYGLSFLGWHQDLKSGKVNISDLNLADRPFHHPQSILTGSKNQAVLTFDIIYATDFRFSGGNSSVIAAEMLAVHELGYRVAIIQIDSPTLRSPRPMNEKISDLIRRLQIPFLTTKDHAECNLLVLRHPTIMQYADRLHANIRAGQVALIVNNPPIGRDGVEAVFDVQRCAENASRAFNQECTVFPESWQIREICKDIWPSLEYAEENWPGFVDVAKYESPRRSSQRERLPNVGRHSRDHRLKWPDDMTDIVAAYIQPSIFGTSILGGADSIMGSLPEESLKAMNVLPFGSMEPADYLSGIDFWVYFHSQDLTESFGMSIVEAMASGSVVILPKYMEAMFGDGAVYGSPSEVARLVQDYWADSKLYVEQSQRGVSFVQEHYSVSAYQHKIRGLLISADSTSKREED